MKKNNIVSFYIVNIITCIIEVLLVWYISNLLFKNKIISFVLGALWLVFGILIAIFLKINQKTSVFKNHQVAYDNPKFEEEFEVIINEFRKYSDCDVEYIYSDALLNPAGAVSSKTIIINPNFLKSSFNKKIIKGLIGHELGHIMSGLIKHSPFAFIHFGSIFQFLLYIELVLCAKDEKKYKVLILLTLPIAILLNLTNYLSIFYYYRKDEHLANYNASLLGCAEELRTYYYLGGVQTPLMRIADVKHPSIKSMLDKLDLWLNKNEFERRIYLAEGLIYRVDNENYSLTIDEMKFKYYRYHQHDNDVIASKYAQMLFDGVGTNKDIKKAINVYKRINTKEAKHMLGVCYISLKELDQGYKILMKNLDYEASRIEMAKKYYNDEEYDKALELIEFVRSNEASKLRNQIEKKKITGA